MRRNFAELLELSAAESGSDDALTRPAIVKELLHYDILLALSESAVGRRIAFQGGTALRLCYGGQRYSEDLDFVCGADAAEPFMLDEVTAMLTERMHERYGLDVTVHEPRPDQSFDRDGIAVKRWRYHIKVPGFTAAQKIHVEFCNVPAYDTSPTLVQPRYSFLDPVYTSIAITTESEREILADKVVALAGRSHVKARDVWDIRWLMQRGHQVDQGLVMSKAADYGLDDLADRLVAVAAKLRAPGAGPAFVSEMQRFVHAPLVAALMREAPPGKSWLEHAAKVAEHIAVELAPRLHPTN